MLLHDALDRYHADAGITDNDLEAMICRAGSQAQLFLPSKINLSQGKMSNT
jgi:hypothetical protein